MHDVTANVHSLWNLPWACAVSSLPLDFLGSAILQARAIHSDTSIQLLTLVPHITMMLASNVRRLASRAAPRISFSTGATIRSSPSSRSMTPLLAVAGVAAFSMALAASREVRS
jgi:hypothetical protein